MAACRGSAGTAEYDSRMGVIVITGATGFVGTNLVAHLLRVRPTVEILCLGRNARKLDALADADHRVVAARADVLNPTFAETVAVALGDRPVDCIVHLASQLTSPNDDIDRAVETLRVNGLGTVAVWRLVERLLKAGGVSSVVHASSILVYGHPGRDPVSEDAVLAPRDVYGASKAASEHIARYFATKFRVPLSVIRPGFIYGPSDSSGKVIYRFVEAAIRGDDLVIRADAGTFRDYVHVDDVGRVIEAAIAAPPDRLNVINASGGEAVTLARLAATVCAATGSSSRIVVDQSTEAQGDPLYGCVVADTVRLRAMLDNPITLDDGIRQLAGDSRV